MYGLSISGIAVALLDDDAMLVIVGTVWNKTPGTEDRPELKSGYYFYDGE